MENRTYGYIRVSTRDQNIARQMEALTSAGVDERFIFIDQISGKSFERSQYNVLKNALRKGDLLIVKSIDRFGRNYAEILEEWKDITKGIQADIKILDMPLLDTTVNDNNLTGTFISDMVLQILSYVAETERRNIKQRQAEGIAVARANGTHMGRPQVEKPANFESIYTTWKDGKITAKVAMETLDLKRGTFYSMVARREGRK